MPHVHGPADGSSGPCRRLPGLALPLLLAAVATPAAAAPETETRVYTIMIDGKQAGTSTQKATRQDDGSATLAVSADVALRVGFIKYTYQFRGTETWKGSVLQKLSSYCNDNGKPYRVEGQIEQTGLRLTVNGSQRLTRADVWTTTYWRLPEVAARAGNLMLLDADTGREIPARLQNVGTQQLAVNGQVVPCTHYRVSGGITADLWYDAQERLVRQEGTEEGHRTVLELNALRR